MSEKKPQKISVTLIITVASWAVSLFLCVFIWVFKIGPEISKTEKLNQQQELGLADVDKMKKALSSESSVKEKIRLNTQELANVTNSHVLSPLLNSYAMQAKELLSFSAAGAGFVLKETSERYRIPFPPQEKTALLYFDRIGVECSGEGTLMELVRFLSSVEERFPYVTVTDLRIMPQKKTPERHRAEFILEWPVVGERPPVLQKGRK